MKVINNAVDLGVIITQYNDFAIVYNNVDDFRKAYLLSGKFAKFESAFGLVDIVKNYLTFSRKSIL